MIEIDLNGNQRKRW